MKCELKSLSKYYIKGVQHRRLWVDRRPGQRDGGDGATLHHDQEDRGDRHAVEVAVGAAGGRRRWRV